MCRPFLLALFHKLTRARLCTTVGFLITSPSQWNRTILRRELAREILSQDTVENEYVMLIERVLLIHFYDV